MENKVKKATEMVYDIAVEYWDIPNDDYNQYLSDLSDLTKEIWEEFNAELLRELKSLNRLPKADYQIFWLECLSYPSEKPRLHDKEGKLIETLYGYLPSKFNDMS